MRTYLVTTQIFCRFVLGGQQYLGCSFLTISFFVLINHLFLRFSYALFTRSLLENSNKEVETFV